ncbi:hypothetical protein AAHA92_07453 [Salvia divinorum]|uniref:Uncharacterized protein n=1 Tax=Salvia divinorum TaxID=28513 RepID=A0ABD1ICI9_SALDI
MNSIIDGGVIIVLGHRLGFKVISMYELGLRRAHSQLPVADFEDYERKTMKSHQLNCGGGRIMQRQQWCVRSGERG